MDLIGQQVQDVKLLDQHGEHKSIADYKGKKVLLYFYPKDMTSGCTVEAKNFRDMSDHLKRLGAEVLGVSCDDVQSHAKFAEKECLNFPLLADVDKKLVEAFGVWVEKSMYGKKYMGIQRDSFLIDEEGKIVKHYSKVDPQTHAEEVLQDLKEMDGGKKCCGGCCCR